MCLYLSSCVSVYLTYFRIPFFILRHHLSIYLSISYLSCFFRSYSYPISISICVSIFFIYILLSTFVLFFRSLLPSYINLSVCVKPSIHRTHLRNYFIIFYFYQLILHIKAFILLLLFFTISSSSISPCISIVVYLSYLIYGEGGKGKSRAQSEVHS